MNAKNVAMALLLLGFSFTQAGCGRQAPTPPAGSRDSQPEAAADSQASSAPPGAEEAPLAPSRLETELEPGLRAYIGETFTGDLDEMVKRRLVRIGVPFNRTFFFLDKGVQHGIASDYGRLIEDRLNEKFNAEKKHDKKIHVYLIPVTREKLLSGLLDGKVDMVVAQVTVRPSLQNVVDFTDPTRTGVNEIVVTGPGEPPVASVEDLSGRTVFVRQTSPYYENLAGLNERLKKQGKPAVEVRAAPENLEDDDLLEMVNAGLIPVTVVDDYLAKFWKQVFPDMTVHENVALATGGNLAVAVRKNNPQLKSALNGFLKKYGQGTSFGNQTERKYLVSTKYVKDAQSDAERKKFLAVVDLFRKYSDQYQMDYLLMAAQGYQESGLRQDAKSHVGAIGVMQIMPPTGRELAVGDIHQVEPNIHGGVKYMRRTMDTYFANEPMDDLNKGLMTFASYNAGPGRVRQLRREAEKQGLDPNVWFGNVETVAAERIGRETVTYVSNIYKYYVAYRLVVEESSRRDASKAKVKANKGK